MGQVGLNTEIKLIKIKDHSGAGTSPITSIAVDTQGYGGVLLLTSFGTAAADNVLKAQQSDDDGVADNYGDIAGSKVVSGADPSNEDVWLDILFPGKRYVKLIATPATSSTVESMWALLYNPDHRPVDNTIAGTITGVALNTPAEGTP